MALMLGHEWFYYYVQGVDSWCVQHIAAKI